MKMAVRVGEMRRKPFGIQLITAFNRRRDAAVKSEAGAAAMTQIAQLLT